jgi:hypothetical protein
MADWHNTLSKIYSVGSGWRTLGQIRLYSNSSRNGLDLTAAGYRSPYLLSSLPGVAVSPLGNMLAGNSPAVKKYRKIPLFSPKRLFG